MGMAYIYPGGTIKPRDTAENIIPIQFTGTSRKFKQSSNDSPDLASVKVNKDCDDYVYNKDGDDYDSDDDGDD
ncbi:hypothetical protein ElyMa_004180800 [Elysia marginata]|uniref:Uncharacterized protein n=1 Tax=Elysia marginata TaxID=1093978 RepID=A0AAV4GL83_9GAST|nr:hypothetical protein ElyMa_004180800 [Elysia marginata]